MHTRCTPPAPEGPQSPSGTPPPTNSLAVRTMGVTWTSRAGSRGGARGRGAGRWRPEMLWGRVRRGRRQAEPRMRPHVSSGDKCGLWSTWHPLGGDNALQGRQIWTPDITPSHTTQPCWAPWRSWGRRPCPASGVAGPQLPSTGVHACRTPDGPQWTAEHSGDPRRWRCAAPWMSRQRQRSGGRGTARPSNVDTVSGHRPFSLSPLRSGCVGQERSLGAVPASSLAGQCPRVQPCPGKGALRF